MNRRKDTYHSQRDDHNGIDVRARRLIGNLGDGVHDVRAEAELEHTLHDTRAIEEGVHEQDAPLLEWLHLGKGSLHRERADLGRDGEEELGPVRHLRLDPHVTHHKGDESLRDG